MMRRILDVAWIGLIGGFSVLRLAVDRNEVALFPPNEICTSLNDQRAD